MDLYEKYHTKITATECNYPVLQNKTARERRSHSHQHAVSTAKLNTNLALHKKV